MSKASIGYSIEPFQKYTDLVIDIQHDNSYNPSFPVSLLFLLCSIAHERLIPYFIPYTLYLIPYTFSPSSPNPARVDPHPLGNCHFWNHAFTMTSISTSVCAYPPSVSNPMGTRIGDATAIFSPSFWWGLGKGGGRFLWDAPNASVGPAKAPRRTTVSWRKCASGCCGRSGRQ